MTSAPCPKCNTAIEFVVVQPQILNFIGTSLMLCEHGGVTTCPGCLTRLIPQIAGIQGIAFGLCVAPDQDPAKKLIAPGSLLSH